MEISTPKAIMRLTKVAVCPLQAIIAIWFIFEDEPWMLKLVEPETPIQWIISIHWLVVSLVGIFIFTAVAIASHEVVPSTRKEAFWRIVQIAILGAVVLIIPLVGDMCSIMPLKAKKSPTHVTGSEHRQQVERVVEQKGEAGSYQ